MTLVPFPISLSTASSEPFRVYSECTMWDKFDTVGDEVEKNLRAGPFIGAQKRRKPLNIDLNPAIAHALLK